MAVACVGQKELADWLHKTGIVLKGQSARRVIIDLEVGKPIKAYVEQFGDSRIFDVAPLDCTGAEVQIASHREPSTESG